MRERILTIRLSAVGDVLRLLPALAALRAARPDPHFTHLVDERAAGALELYPGLDEVIVAPRRGVGLATVLGIKRGDAFHRFRSLRERLRKPPAPWDLVVDFHGLLKSAWLARLAASRRTVGFARPWSKEASSLLYGETAPGPPGTEASRFQRNQAMLDFLGIPRHVPPPGTFAVPPEALAVADEWLAARGLAPKTAVFLWPGTSEAQAHKRWPLPGWRQVAKTLVDQGHPVILGWGPAEKGWMEEWLQAPDGGIHVPPLLSLTELGGLLQRSRAFCGGDTGPMHLAALLGVPSLVLYGPTSPVVNRSWLAETRALEGPEAEAWRAIPAAALHREPLGGLEPAEVFAALAGVLRGGQAHAD